MTRPWLGSFASVIMCGLACGPDTGGVGDGSGSSSGSGSGSSTGVTSNTTMMATTNVSADGTSSSGAVDTGSGSAPSSGGSEVTTDPGTSSSGTAGATDGSSSGEPPGESYPGCMADEDCPEPYTLCWPPMEFGTPNFCTLECSDAGECPLPTSGMATPVCEGPPGTDICALDCTEGECPDGMSCIDVFGNGDFLRCTRT